MAQVVPIQLSAALGHVPRVEQVCDCVLGDFGQSLLPMRTNCVLLNRCPIKWCCNGVETGGTFSRFVELVEAYTTKKACLLNSVTNYETLQRKNSFLASLQIAVNNSKK